MKKIILLLIVCSGLHAQQWTTTPPDWWYSVDAVGPLIERACILHKQLGFGANDNSIWLTNNVPIEAITLAKQSGHSVYLPVDNNRGLFVVFFTMNKYVMALVIKSWLK